MATTARSAAEQIHDRREQRVGIARDLIPHEMVTAQAIGWPVRPQEVELRWVVAMGCSRTM